MQIYLMNNDGSGLVRLTDDPANDEAPQWSPDNSRIVFQSDRDNLFSGSADIYVMNWDGSGQTRLTSDANDDSAPVWSPDGTKIAFQSARNGVNYQVYVMNADGSGQVNISNNSSNERQPSLSPDCTKIAFTSDRDHPGMPSVYVMNASGSNQTRLTFSDGAFSDEQPAWSPDGLKLAFTSTRDSVIETWQETDDEGAILTRTAVRSNKEVYLMNADGSAALRLTNTLENDDSPAWSADGTKIVFRSERERDCCDPTPQVWVMNPDGTSQANLSNNGYGDHCPSWQHIASNVPPGVSVTSPANGATFVAPANITITASAGDSDGTISRVDFYQGATLIGTDTIAPYSFTWNNVAAASYSLTARATDNDGATSTSAAVNITVNAVPTVSVTSPVNGATFLAPANITITANASDSDGTISRVDFYQGAILIGTDTMAPYTFNWNNVAAGSYSLTARATDNGGATSTSAAVNITVNAAPTVSITSPANGTTVTTPANITITASASDSDGTISKVDFYQGTTLIGTDTAAPYSFVWNNVAAGNYSLTARATDNGGATSTSGAVTVTANAPPTVSITSPANGASFTAPASITILASASDSDGAISKVDFYQGTTLIGTDTTAPYSFVWSNVAAGTYSLTAKATDNGGATSTSGAVTVSVNAAPTVSITSPANGASFTAPASITISASASDSDGTISKVDFYQGTTLIGTDTTTPYSFNWNNVAAGSYALTAKATDNSGVTNTSGAVTVTVNANGAPTVSITSPANGASFTAPANISITANASDSDGTVSKVDFYRGTTLIGTDTTAPYSFVWNNVAAGSYALTAKATDNGGTIATSNVISVTVNPPNQLPVANAGGPYGGTVGQSVQFIGSGSTDPDGTITAYSWNFGDNTSGTGATPTHTYAAAGTYTITLTVTDNDGATKSATTTANISASSNDQFVQNFYQWALLRQPTSSESTHWTDIMRAAYPQGQTSMLIAMREFGMTVFESAEYAARNRSDHDYVYDLYKTYLMREPDQQGWDNWTASVPLYGREHVRRGFDESTEFINLVSTLTSSGSPSTAVSSLVTARVDPFNQPGSGLLARDAEWSMPLVSLPGRAGLDLGLSLSYSSMVWTRSGPALNPYLYFDEDNGSLSPGFRLGFPTIHEKSFDAQISRNVYVLLTPGGSRVELRQVGTSNVYEAADSSYLQLIEGGSLLLRTTDGTQLTYWWFNHEFRCVEIKDRNGNYLTASYDWRGDIQNITDTLGRVITFNYDGNANLSTIRQSWNGQTHTWASFGWGTVPMHPTFSGVSVVGTYDGEVIPVLTQVGLDDGSYFTFQYTGAGQVNIIRRYRSDNVQSSYTAYDYQSTANDCPRISQTRVWAENWTGLNGVPAEVVTQFSGPGDGSHQMTGPDGTVYKEFYGTGWQKGLTTQSEVWSGGVRQKWTTAAWTQDNQSVSYKTNPRVIETNIYDSSGNRRRTTIDYGAYAQYGLPYLVKEYAADGTTEIRQSFTDYNLAQAYLDRRIIGLPSQLHLADSSGYQAKLSYGYDDPAKITSQATTASMHDQAYDSSFTVRGNVTSVSRWAVTDINNAAKALTTQVGYNAAGSVLTSADPLGHQSSIGYADSFSDGNNSRNTFAYPTTATDAAGNSSLIRYNYDFGAKTRAQGPPPAGQTQGVIQTVAYDSAARLQQVTTTNNGAYQRYVYGPNYVQSFGSVNTVADDAYAIQVFDGAGRVIGAANYHPGSTGGYSMVNTIYDLMGRAVKQSNPGEINTSWVPVGDDAAGLLYTQQTYDWKGRPLVTTNTDGTQKYASYGGCGCAGGEVVTLTDEVGRQQKVYSDVLGRTWKAEILNDDDSVYSTIANTFNARDQVTLVRQYQGADTSGVYQDTTMTYDGYGRLQTRHAPEQDTGTSTVYAYNPDGTIYSVTDARGASATYTHNARHLVTGITYSAPYGIQATPNVSFGYDATGNRTSMSDGTGSTSYNYNQLSQMTSEARTFTGVGTYALSYQYNLAGELTSITDPANATINYEHDSAGRVTSVTGSPYGTGGINGTAYIEISQYAANLQYRAWGGLKSLTYGNNLTLSIGYDSRLRGAEFEVTGRPAQFGPPTVMKAQYQYHEDSSPKYAHDLLDERFDRAFSYDNVGGLKEAYSGSEARDYVNGTNSGTVTGPYRQSYQHDAFGNMTNRTNRFWSQSDTLTASYTNNRRQDSAFQYDAAGNLTQDADLQYTYDALGRNASIFSAAANKTIAPLYDGDGQGVRRVEIESGVTSVTYYVRSTVLGKVITELNAQGAKLKTNVYLGGQVLARQEPNWIVWQHDNPLTGSRGISNRDSWYSAEIEPDPMGINVGFGDPYINCCIEPPADQPVPFLLAGAGIPDGRCTLDGMAIDCGWAMNLLSIGAAEFAPPTTVWANGRWNFVHFNPNSGSYEARVFSHYDYTSVTIDGRTSGGWHPVFDTIMVRASTYALHDVWLQTLKIAQDQTTDQFAPDAVGIRGNIATALQDSDCANFIKNLLGRIASDGNPLVEGGDLLKVFDKVMTQGKLFRGPGPGGAQAIGSVGEGNAQIRFGTVSGQYRTAEQLQKTLLWFDSHNVIHELIHLALRDHIGDRNLAMAVDPNLKDIPFPAGGTDAQKTSWVLNWSDKFDTQLRKHCKRTRSPYFPP